MNRRVPRGTLLAATLALLATAALAQQQEAPAQAPAPAATPAPAPAPAPAAMPAPAPAPAPAPVAAAPAAAPAAAALPPGSPLIGRPEQSRPRAKLAPVPSPPLAAAADKLPLDKLKAPTGFNIEVYAAGMPNARSLALGDKGTVFVGSRLQDKVYAIINKDGKREVKVLVSGLYRPNGVASRTARSTSPSCRRSPRSTMSRTDLDNPPKPAVIYDDLPKDEAHGWKFMAIGPDNKLYFRSASPATTCCMTTITARSAASISTAPAPK